MKNEDKSEVHNHKNRRILTGSGKILILTAAAFVVLFVILIPTYFSRLQGANFGRKAVFVPFSDYTPAPLPTPVPEISESPVPEETSSEPVSDVGPMIQIFEYTDLKMNDKSDSVRNLQNRLMELGYLDSDQPESDYNEATAAAVALFQRTINAVTDGIAHADIQSLLFRDDAATYEAKCGDTGSDIYSIQSHLTTLGYYTGKINGYYGTATEDAVIAFQQKNKLTSDGVFHSDDREILFSDDARPLIDPTPTPKPTATAKPKKTHSNNSNSGKDNSSGTKSSGGNSNSGGNSGSGVTYPTGGSFNASGDVSGVISVATAQIGKQYVTGDEGPDTFDCSGLVYYCLKTNGVSISRRSAASYAENENWTLISSMSDVRKGDLLFYKSDSSDRVSHVAIYIGGGSMIDASSSRGEVVKRSATSDYWARNFVCARRVFG